MIYSEKSYEPDKIEMPPLPEEPIEIEENVQGALCCC